MSAYLEGATLENILITELGYTAEEAEKIMKQINE